MAVTITYEFPTAGVTAPTLAVMSKKNEVQATIEKTADGDATATITHNMALPAAQITQGFPEIELEPLKSNFWTTKPFVASVTATTVVVTLGTGGGSGVAGGQMRVRIKRPLKLTE